MKGFLVWFLWACVYVGLGVMFESCNIIKSPATWAFYGAIMAIIYIEAQDCFKCRGMKYLLILLIPIFIMQHSMREKPYNDTLTVSWIKITRDTVERVEHKKNITIITSDGKKKRYHKRFFTICIPPVIPFITLREQKSMLWY